MPDYLYAHPYIDVRVRAGKRFAFADKIVVNMQQHRRFSWRAVPLGFLLNVEAAVEELQPPVPVPVPVPVPALAGPANITSGNSPQKTQTQQQRSTTNLVHGGNTMAELDPEVADGLLTKDILEASQAWTFNNVTDADNDPATVDGGAGGSNSSHDADASPCQALELREVQL